MVFSSFDWLLSVLLFIYVSPAVLNFEGIFIAFNVKSLLKYVVIVYHFSQLKLF